MEQRLALIVVTTGILLAGLPGIVGAQTTINFDVLPDGAAVPAGTAITTQYMSVGVASFGSEGGPPTARVLRVAGMSGDNTLAPAPCCTSYIEWTFASPVRDVQITGLDIGRNGLRMECFDMAGVSVGSDSEMGTGAGVGEIDTLSVMLSGISRCRVAQVGTGSGDGYIIDDLVFTAGPDCGDGMAEGTEECDEGAANGTPGSCCTESCTFRPAAEVCRTSAGLCDVEDVCSGTEGTCPDDVLAPAATVCRAAADVCDVEEACDGTTAACPADAFADVSLECRAAAGDCDVAEACDGASAACPADTFIAAETECRAAASSCDAAELCDGASAVCPVDAFAADGTSCDDSLTCTPTSVCGSGACVGDGPLLDCDDANVCTSDMCVEPGGCVNEPIIDCCANDEDCSDSDQCTTDTCDVDTGMCTNTPIAGCGMVADGGGPPDPPAGGGGAVDDGGCGCSVPGQSSDPSAPLSGAVLLGLCALLYRRRC